MLTIETTFNTKEYQNCSMANSFLASQFTIDGETNTFKEDFLIFSLHLIPISWK